MASRCESPTRRSIRSAYDALQRAHTRPDGKERAAREAAIGHRSTHLDLLDVNSRNGSLRADITYIRFRHCRVILKPIERNGTIGFRLAIARRTQDDKKRRIRKWRLSRNRESASISYSLDGERANASLRKTKNVADHPGFAEGSADPDRPRVVGMDECTIY